MSDEWAKVRKRVDDLSCQCHDDYNDPWKFENLVTELVMAARKLSKRAERDVSDTVAYTTNQLLAELDKALEPFEGE